MIAHFLRALGRPFISFWTYLGEIVLLAAETFRSIFTHKVLWKLFLKQVVEIGLLSQLVVVITGGFTGAVFAAQTFFQFNKLGMGSATGAVVSVAICRELGPVLTALMVTLDVPFSFSVTVRFELFVLSSRLMPLKDESWAVVVICVMMLLKLPGVKKLSANFQKTSDERLL